MSPEFHQLSVLLYFIKHSQIYLFSLLKISSFRGGKPPMSSRPSYLINTKKQVTRLYCLCDASSYWKILSRHRISASFVYLVNQTVDVPSAAHCVSLSTLLSLWSHPLGQAGDQGSSILISQRVTEKLSGLWKVKQPVFGQAQNRIKVCWPPCLLLRRIKDKRSDSWAEK